MVQVVKTDCRQHSDDFKLNSHSGTSLLGMEGVLDNFGYCEVFCAIMVVASFAVISCNYLDSLMMEATLVVW